jgi:hypothetical protein
MIACYGYTFLAGAEALLAVKESRKWDRRRMLESPVHTQVEFDDGILDVRTEPGFILDFRSGSPLLDWFAPNLGSLDERHGWWMHDCLAYAQSLNFRSTNYALKYYLRDIVGYCKMRAELVRKAVSISKKWYGRPKPTEWSYANIVLVRTIWTPKR